MHFFSLVYFSRFFTRLATTLLGGLRPPTLDIGGARPPRAPPVPTPMYNNALYMLYVTVLGKIIINLHGLACVYPDNSPDLPDYHFSASINASKWVTGGARG
jgi:hypothetical protein